jgi:hypothetical protein
MNLLIVTGWFARLFYAYEKQTKKLAGISESAAFRDFFHEGRYESTESGG